MRLLFGFPGEKQFKGACPKSRRDERPQAGVYSACGLSRLDLRRPLVRRFSPDSNSSIYPLHFFREDAMENDSLPYHPIECFLHPFGVCQVRLVEQGYRLVLCRRVCIPHRFTSEGMVYFFPSGFQCWIELTYSGLPDIQFHANEVLLSVANIIQQDVRAPNPHIIPIVGLWRLQGWNLSRCLQLGFEFRPKVQLGNCPLYIPKADDKILLKGKEELEEHP